MFEYWTTQIDLQESQQANKRAIKKQASKQNETVVYLSISTMKSVQGSWVVEEVEVIGVVEELWVVVVVVVAIAEVVVIQVW